MKNDTGIFHTMNKIREICGQKQMEDKVVEVPMPIMQDIEGQLYEDGADHELCEAESEPDVCPDTSPQDLIDDRY